MRIKEQSLLHKPKTPLKGRFCIRKASNNSYTNATDLVIKVDYEKYINNDLNYIIKF